MRNIAVVALALLLISMNAHAFEAFFPFCIDTHDSEKRSLQQQAEMVKELGFNGVGHLWLDNLDERCRTLDALGLKLYQIAITVSMDPARQAEPCDPRLAEAMRSLKGRNVEFLLLMQGAKPSDPSVDSRAIELVSKMAAVAAENGHTLLLYPHAGDWCEKVEDAVRIAQKVDKPNVGVMFNLCHWLKAGRGENLKALLDLAKPYLKGVSINGADTAQEVIAGTGNWIQPLGTGSYDICNFLKTLKASGYTGKIGLQCYGIPGDARIHLEKSMIAWKELNKHLQE